MDTVKVQQLHFANEGLPGLQSSFPSLDCERRNTDGIDRKQRFLPSQFPDLANQQGKLEFRKHRRTAWFTTNRGQLFQWDVCFRHITVSLFLRRKYNFDLYLRWFYCCVFSSQLAISPQLLQLPESKLSSLSTSPITFCRMDGSHRCTSIRTQILNLCEQ